MKDLKVIAVVRCVNEFVRASIGHPLRDNNFQTKYVGKKIIKVIR